VIQRVLMSALLFAFCGSFAVAAPPTLSNKPAGAEAAFVAQVQRRLTALYPTANAAERAGYFRYTNEDRTGAISYANNRWDNSRDLDRPSQLWYDLKGNLLGVDYAVPVATTPNAPHFWGVNPQRWFKFHPHVHYVVKDASGNMIYGHATSAAKFAAAGGDVNNPQASVLVKMGLIKDASTVTHIFAFPLVWDLEFWLTPNPLGAFAQTNPLVHPSPNAGRGEDM